MTPDVGLQILLLIAKATLLLVLAAAFLGLMRRSSTAASRHFVCATVLASLLLLPVTVFVSLPGAAENWPAYHLVIRSTNLISSAATGVIWPNLVLLVWVVGSLAFVLRSFMGWTLVRKNTCRFARFENEEWLADLEALAGRIGVDASSVTLRTGRINSPACCGMFSRTILLPKTASDWDAFRRRTVLLHELAHIRRNDGLWLRIANCACALFWFHPLAWRIAARLSSEQELACDDLVLAAGIEPRAFATLLLNSAQELSSSSLFACAFHGALPADQLRARFANILECRKARTRNRNWSRGFIAALGCLVLAVSSVTLARAEQIYRIGGDVKPPVLLQKSEPEYTAAAKKAKVQGAVLLSVVIGRDGRVHSAHIDRSLDRGLNAHAIKAVKTWRFRPAQRYGKPVAVHANIEVNFRLL